ncbi:MAG: hypothetical protein NC041_07050 [Bacteroides sp.]|nr:hypothetical protein [Prevotella sp.]MCM1407054.1 hypothetical protein [Treponema brennaborense]MCM1470206.1 hypothetical protein [Bacteroides sp.]
MIDLNELAYKAYSVSCVRAQKDGVGVQALNLLKHCATEVVEAMNAYDAYEFEENTEKREILYKDFAGELADIITCVLIIGAKEPVINMEKALQQCLEKNKKRIIDADKTI